MLRLLITAGLAALLVSCATLLEPLNPRVVETETVGETAVPQVDFDPLESPEAQCAYVWASRHLPEYTDLLQAAFRAASIEGAAAEVSGYGENCLHPETKEILRYAIMRTDFYLSIEVEDVENGEALGRSLSGVMAVLQRFPPDTFPGLQPASVFVRFHSGEATRNLSFTMDVYEQALEDGLRGGALIEALAPP